MTLLDSDLPLNHPERPSVPRRAGRPPSPTRWVVVGAAAVIAVSALAFWWMSRSPLEPVTPAPTPSTSSLNSNRPRRQPMELPGLDASDTWLSQLIGGLSRHPLLARLLATPGIVRNATLAVEQIGEGRTPADPLRVLRPLTRLNILGTDSGRLDPASYSRWDSATNTLVSINPNDAAQLYVNIKPLFDQAYRDLGHPNHDFDEALVKAINTLAATPAMSGDPELQRRPAYFEHVDPALRAALPVQKQLLLVGPANRQKIMSWLHQLAAALDLKVD